MRSPGQGGNAPLPDPAAPPEAGQPDTPQITLQSLVDHYDRSCPISSKTATAQRLRALEAGELRLLVEQMILLPSGRLRDDLLASTIERWAELDPESLIRLASGDTMPAFAEGLMLSAGFAVLPRVNLALARELALQTHGEERYRQVLAPLLASMAAVDPELGASWLDDRDLVPQEDRERVAWRFYAAWAELDPAAAARRADRDLNEGKLIAIAEVWAAIDPEAFAAWAAEFESVDLKIAALDEVAEATAFRDGGELALGLLEEFFPNRIPRGALSRTGQQIFAHGVDRGLSWLSTIDDPTHRMDIGRNVARRLAYDHPGRASDLLQQFPEGAKRRELIVRLVEPMARTDLDAALEWANSLAKGADRQTALVELVEFDPTLVGEIGNTDGFSYNEIGRLARRMGTLHEMAAVQSWIDQLPRPDQRRNALASVQTQWADEPHAAIAYMQAIDLGGTAESERWRTRQLQQLTREWGRTEPDEASRWAAEQGFQHTVNQIRSASIVRLLESGDRGAAIAQLEHHLAELERLPDEQPSHPGAYSESASAIARNWTVRDPHSAAAWATTIESPIVRERAISSVASTWARFDPVAASAWASDLPAATGEREAALNLFYHWSRTEEEAARQALQRMPLEDSERAAALAAFPDGEEVK